LLPVSIAETPSIWMLAYPPPPIRPTPAIDPSDRTPGVSSARVRKLRLEIGRFSTDVVETVNERSPLDA